MSSFLDQLDQLESGCSRSNHPKSNSKHDRLTVPIFDQCKEGESDPSLSSSSIFGSQYKHAIPSEHEMELAHYAHLLPL
ncbi:hypothetical protein LguiA_002774 [Lonicera macranthoides]